MAGKGNPRTGGKVKGQLNKATIERLELQARAVAQSKQAGRKLGREVLDDLMHLAVGMTGRAQQEYEATRSVGTKATVKELADELYKWADIAGTFAKALADFQSPKLRAILIPPAPPMPLAPKRDDGNVMTIDDPAALQRMYLKAIGKVQTG